MSRATHIAHLPLKLSVVPTMVTRWLRVAGIPIAPFDTVATTDSLRGETILYDSRSAASRNSVESATSAHAHLIDVAPLLSSDLTEENSTHIWKPEAPVEPSAFMQGRLFLERLKHEIDLLGQCWVRLADYPFPYQSVLCIGKIPQEATEAASNVAFAPFPTQFNQNNTERVQTARKRYAGGLPFFSPTLEAEKTLFKLENPPKGFPLLWRTTFEEFLLWRRLRMQATFEVKLQNGIYHIESQSSFGRYRPQIELWRGGHVASFRLYGAGMSLRETGLVFQQEQGRHPAGFSAHLLHGEALISESLTDNTKTTPQPVINLPRIQSGA